jgi:hypothetical protein
MELIVFIFQRIQSLSIRFDLTKIGSSERKITHQSSAESCFFSLWWSLLFEETVGKLRRLQK